MEVRLDYKKTDTIDGNETKEVRENKLITFFFYFTQN